MDTAAPPPDTQPLVRGLGFWQATAINITQVVGAGVFATIPLILGVLPGPYALLAWLVAGVLMLVMAFWTSGQFFIEKAYTLLVFAGIWALMHGITDIVGAFRLRSLKKVV